MDRGAWWAAGPGVTESDGTEPLSMNTSTVPWPIQEVQVLSQLLQSQAERKAEVWTHIHHFSEDQFWRLIACPLKDLVYPWGIPGLECYSPPVGKFSGSEFRSLSFCLISNFHFAQSATSWSDGWILDSPGSAMRQHYYSSSHWPLTLCIEPGLLA